MNKTKQKKSKSTKKKIGMAPFNGYKDITKEEIEALKHLTLREAIIQTEILLRMTKWMR